MLQRRRQNAEGRLGEGLNQQVANLPKPQGCVRSNRAATAKLRPVAQGLVRPTDNRDTQVQILAGRPDCHGSPTGEAAASNPAQCWFKSSSWHHTCPDGETVNAAALNPAY